MLKKQEELPIIAITAFFQQGLYTLMPADICCALFMQRALTSMAEYAEGYMMHLYLFLSSALPE